MSGDCCGLTGSETSEGLGAPEGHEAATRYERQSTGPQATWNEGERPKVASRWAWAAEPRTGNDRKRTRPSCLRNGRQPFSVRGAAGDVAGRCVAQTHVVQAWNWPQADLADEAAPQPARLEGRSRPANSLASMCERAPRALVNAGHPASASSARSSGRDPRPVARSAVRNLGLGAPPGAVPASRAGDRLALLTDEMIKRNAAT